MEAAATVTLNNGVVMPTLGLGVWQMDEGEETGQAVTWALEAGYRLIDTAKLYANERSVGRAVRASGVKREEVFVTTKLWPTDFADAEAAFERSFKKLDLGYIDLYLIHFPLGLIPGFGNVRNKIWDTLVKIQASGRVRAIGVSNYSIVQIKEVLAHGIVPPTVNQIKCNPFVYDKELLEFCQSAGIVVEAYSPLTRAHHLDHPTVTVIAKAHGRSPAQVLIRWALQHGTVVIPKSSRKERIIENAQVFDFALTALDMATLDDIS